MFLLADIGGTNTRLALAKGLSMPPVVVESFENAGFDSFEDVLHAFLAGHDRQPIEAACIAVAGAVNTTTARLTNRDWLIDADRLIGRFAIGRVALINDLSALGYSLAKVPDTGLLTLRSPQAGAKPNGQSIVVGVGTGLNTCAVSTAGGRPPVILQAEYGHSALPFTVSQLLDARLGAAATGFNTVEDCMSGRGFTAIDAAINGSGRDGRDIVHAALAGQDGARQAVDIMGACLGHICEALTYQFMPLNGIFIAGSVARGIIQAGGDKAILGTISGRTGPLQDSITPPPVYLLTDDAAGLLGCQARLENVDRI